MSKASPIRSTRRSSSSSHTCSPGCAFSSSARIVRHVVAAEAHARADAQRARGRPLRADDLLVQAVGRFENAAGPRIGERAFLGDMHAPRGAPEQRDAERALEIGDALADVGGRDPEIGRGGIEARVTRHRAEHPQIGQVPRIVHGWRHCECRAAPMIREREVANFRPRVSIIQEAIVKVSSLACSMLLGASLARSERRARADPASTSSGSRSRTRWTIRSGSARRNSPISSARRAAAR